jgi:hypothetical protein
VLTPRLCRSVKAGTEFKDHNAFIEQARNALNAGDAEQMQKAAKYGACGLTAGASLLGC